MHSFHEGPKIDAQYFVSVQAPKQFPAVLIGTFLQNFLNGAEFILRTWRSFRLLGYSSHVWNPMTSFRVRKSFPWTLYRVSGIQSTLGNPISFRAQFWPYIYIYPRVLPSVFFPSGCRNTLVYACSIFLISWLSWLKFEIKDLHVMPSSLWKLRQKERYLTLRRLMSYIYGAPILDVSRSHTTTQHSR